MRRFSKDTARALAELIKGGPQNILMLITIVLIIVLICYFFYRNFKKAGNYTGNLDSDSKKNIHRKPKRKKKK